MTNPEILKMLLEIDDSLDHQLLCARSTRAKVGCTCGGLTAHIWSIIRAFIAINDLKPTPAPPSE